MLDIKKIRQNPQLLRDALKARGKDLSIDSLLQQDEHRLKLLAEAEEKKAQRNAASKKIGLAKKYGASDEEITLIMDEMRMFGEQIAALDAQIALLDHDIEAFLMSLPNPPYENVPLGLDETDNVELRRWGTPREFIWEPKTHREIGIDLKIQFGNTAAKNADSEYTVYRGLGARLERAVIQFFLDACIENNYEEIAALHLETASGSASETDPKSNPVIDLYRELILDGAQLPLRHSSFLDAKINLNELVKPDQSDEALDRMTIFAEKEIQLLRLPYRVMERCTGELDFSAAKTYDIEVWLPSRSSYVTIASFSNCSDFLARRAGIRYRDNPKDKPRFIHTINCSGVDVIGMVASILECYQNDDGTVSVPDVLIPYMKCTLIK